MFRSYVLCIIKTRDRREGVFFFAVRDPGKGGMRCTYCRIPAPIGGSEIHLTHGSGWRRKTAHGDNGANMRIELGVGGGEREWRVR